MSLGNVHKLLNSDYQADKLPSGMHSVQGLGAFAPDEKQTFIMYVIFLDIDARYSLQRIMYFLPFVFRSDGTKVPLGRPCKTGVKNPDGYTLNYNEYIVYNTRQIRMKYLVKVQFDYK